MSKNSMDKKGKINHPERMIDNVGKNIGIKSERRSDGSVHTSIYTRDGNSRRFSYDTHPDGSVTCKYSTEQKNNKFHRNYN